MRDTGFDNAVELAYGEWKEKIIDATLQELTFAGVKFRAEHSYTIHFEDEESEKIGKPILDKANEIISKAVKNSHFPFLTAYKSP